MSELQHDLYIFHSCSFFLLPFSMTRKRMEINGTVRKSYALEISVLWSFIQHTMAVYVHVGTLLYLRNLLVYRHIQTFQWERFPIRVWWRHSCERKFSSLFFVIFFHMIRCESLRTISDAFYLIIKTKRTNTLWSDIDINISRYTLMMMLMMICKDLYYAFNYSNHDQFKSILMDMPHLLCYIA